MADSKKINQLDAIPALDPTDVLAIVDQTDSTTKKVAISQFDSRYASASDLSSTVSNLKWKNSVRVATTTNGTLATAYANGQTVDGITLVTGNRILIKDQTTATENGIYTVNASGAPTRATDFASWTQIVKAACLVEDGTYNVSKMFICNVLSGGTVGSTDIVFQETAGSNGGVQSLYSEKSSDTTITAAYNDTVAGAGLAQVGTVQVQLTILSTSDLVILTFNGLGETGSGKNHIMGYQVDSTTAVVINIPDTNTQEINWTQQITGLSPGLHTFKLMAARAGSNWVLYGTANSTAGYPMRLSGSVISGGTGSGFGTSVQNTQISKSADTTITQAYSNVAGGGMAVISGLSVTFSTSKANEWVFAEFQGYGEFVGDCDIVMGFKLDATTARTRYYNSNPSGAGTARTPISMFAWFQVASPGNFHTIGVCASKSSSNNPVLVGTGFNTNENQLTVTRLSTLGGSPGIILDYIYAKKSSDQNITGSQQLVSGMSVIFTTTFSNQLILICPNMFTQLIGGGGSDTFYFFYSIDGGTTKVGLFADEMTPSNFCTTYRECPVVIPDPGSYTLTIYASKGGNNFTVYGNGAAISVGTESSIAVKVLNKSA